MLTDNGILYGIDAKTGEELASLRLGGSFVASPLVAGDYLYACDEDGTTIVVRTRVPPEIVAKNRLQRGNAGITGRGGRGDLSAYFSELVQDCSSSGELGAARAIQ